MKIWSRILTVLFAGLVLAARFPAVADTVPAATYTIHVNGVANQHSPGTVSSAGAGASAQATAGAFPSPFLDMTATGSAFSGDLASGDIEYYFEFFGAAGTTVPVQVSYNMSFSADQGCCSAGGGATFEDVSLALQDGAGTFAIDGACMANASGCNHVGSDVRDASPIQSSFSGALHGVLNANTVYRLALFAEAASFGDPSNPSSAHAFVDPVISIDPSFAGDPNAYSLILSSGVGNSTASTSATPEPAAMGLMAAGLITFAMFRRRRI